MRIKKISLITSFSLILLIITSCTICCQIKGNTKNFISGVSLKRISEDHYTATNPSLIKLTQKTSLKKYHHLIGYIKVKRYNLVGIKRQQAVIDDMLQKYAATIGGKAVVHIQQTDTQVKGNIVR